MRTAVDEINSQGGLKGEKINLIMVDDQCDDRIAVSTAQMMAVNVSERDKMSLVIGPYCSNALQKIAGIYAKAGILQIIPTSVSTSIQNGNYKGLVKMVGYKTRQAGDYFKFYQDHFPDRKVALIYDRNDKDVVEVAAAVQKLFADAGKRPLSSHTTFKTMMTIMTASPKTLSATAIKLPISWVSPNVWRVWPKA